MSSTGEPGASSIAERSHVARIHHKISALIDMGSLRPEGGHCAWVQIGTICFPLMNGAYGNMCLWRSVIL